MSGAEGLCAALADISHWGGSWGGWGGCWGWWCCWGAVGLSLNSLSNSKAICCIKRTLSTGESCLARFSTSCKFTSFSQSLEPNCTTVDRDRYFLPARTRVRKGGISLFYLVLSPTSLFLYLRMLAMSNFQRNFQLFEWLPYLDEGCSYQARCG